MAGFYENSGDPSNIYTPTAKQYADEAKASALSAANSDVDSANSAADSASSAASALSSKNSAASSATAASQSANSSAGNEAACAASEANAVQAASDAATSASESAVSAGQALSSASSASSSASSASSSAGSASASKTAAGISETNAAASASSASISASNALASENAAAISESNAAGSEAVCTASEATAVQAASNASTSEGNAATSASSALSSANSASSSESNASSSEANALVSENNASASESNASISETNSASSESSAAQSAIDALASENKAQLWAEQDEDVPVEVGEYSAKHWAKKAEGIVTGDLEAVNVGYDNTTSELTAVNVQFAIDEVEGRLDSAESKLAGVEVGAEVNTINAGDNISQLVNDSGYALSSSLNTSNWDIAYGWGNHASAGYAPGSSVQTNVPAGAVFTDTTYSIGDGGLTQKNFTSTLKTKLDGIDVGANNYAHPATHSIAEVSGLQGALDGKATSAQGTKADTAHGWGNHAGAGYAPTASPSFSGAPTAPTPTAGDDSTKLATTEFVNGAMPTVGATVTSSGSNSNGYYRIWSDGFKEQWGTGVSATGWVLQYYPVAFTSIASVRVTFAQRHSGAATSNAVLKDSGFTTTYFSQTNGGASGGIHWHAKGY